MGGENGQSSLSDRANFSDYESGFNFFGRAFFDPETAVFLSKMRLYDFSRTPTLG